MAYIQLNYRSKALNMVVPVNVILPERTGREEEAVYKTLYLFHGASGDHTSWMRKTSIERYADEYGIAVVMPEVGNSWYTDTCYGAKYFTFVTEELPAVCRSYFRGMSARREDNLVAGLSMGGYGALKVALTYPERYYACASLSGALDITRKGRSTDLNLWRANFDFQMQDPMELEGSSHDIYALTRKNKREGKAFPKLYLWCGTEDALIENNRSFHLLLESLDIKHCYEESEGNHSWKWWDLHIQDALRCLLENGGA